MSTVTKRVTTITLTGEVTEVKFNRGYPYFEVVNTSDAPVYLSRDEECEPNADGVYTVPANGGKVARLDTSVIYVKGSGTVQITAKYEADPSFKSAPKGGEGGIAIKQYEYVSTQKSGISTGVQLNKDHTIECVYEYNSNDNNLSVFGNHYSSRYPSWILYYSKYYYGTNGSEGSASVPIAKDTVCKVAYNDSNNNIVYSIQQSDGTWDEHIVAQGITVGAPDGYTYIIGDRPADGGMPLVGKIYSFRLYDKAASTLIADFVPAALVDGDTIIGSGMYDLITKTYCGNADWDVGGNEKGVLL